MIGLPHADLGEQVTAVVVREPGAAGPGEQSVIDALKHDLAGFKIPKQVFFRGGDAAQRDGQGAEERAERAVCSAGGTLCEHGRPARGGRQASPPSFIRVRTVRVHPGASHGFDSIVKTMTPRGSRESRSASPNGSGVWIRRPTLALSTGMDIQLKFRDSKCLNQVMDSRFRGNDVISARRVAFRLAVIPAKAGIHFGRRIPKLEIQVWDVQARSFREACRSIGGFTTGPPFMEPEA